MANLFVKVLTANFPGRAGVQHKTTYAKRPGALVIKNQ